MRESLFRGKRIDNGEWVYGYPIIVSYKAWIKDINDTTTNPRRLAQNYADFRCVEVEKETVGQCTGLKDKNGTGIFEGDIVKDGAGQINPIVFSNSTYWFNWLHLIDAIEPLTVIGNIHEQED